MVALWNIPQVLSESGKLKLERKKESCRPPVHPHTTGTEGKHETHSLMLCFPHLRYQSPAAANHYYNHQLIRCLFSQLIIY